MLQYIIYSLLRCRSLIEKLEKLDEFIDKKAFENFFLEKDYLKQILNFNKIEDEYIAKSLYVIDQHKHIFIKTSDIIKKFQNLCKYLIKIDEFYSSIGGLIGYHYKFISLLKDENSINYNFFVPNSFNIFSEDEDLNEIAIKNFDKLALIYPMGGTADRLKLKSDRTNLPLPAAKLIFLGKTLLEHMIDEVRSLEHLYFKKYNKEIITPIVIMTSSENENHKLIYSFIEEKDFFGRGKDNFHFINQISSPLISENGNWVITEPFKIGTKPSGHGVLWKLMIDQKAFDFLDKHNRKKALVRQINNPIANTDNTLLSFIGIGFKYEKKFGFLSCERDLKNNEGLNILKEKKEKNYQYNYSNIEYTEFKKFKTSDSLEKFPANTNTLFVDLNEIYKTATLNPFPEFIINLKTDINEYDGKTSKKIKAGRLESMMQNASDFIIDFFDNKIEKMDEKDLKTFIALQSREKSISTTKKCFENGQINETPEKCLYDILNNNRNLLITHCHSKAPDMPTIDDYIKNGPSFLFLYNPILGPLYSDISKKIVTSEFKENFELYINISNLLLENIYLNGSLIIDAKTNSHKKNFNSKCILKNVKINNKGIDRTKKNCYIKYKVDRKEYLKIKLNEDSEFHANNIIFNNTYEITVPPYSKMFAIEEQNKIKFIIEKK